MSDEILLENSVSREGLRVLHVMGLQPVSRAWLDYVPDRAMAEVRNWRDEVNLYHLQAKWQAREVIQWTFQDRPFLVRRNVVLWHIRPGQRANQAVREAALAYALNLDKDPQFAFMCDLPRGAEEGMEVGKLMLIRDGSIPKGFVLLDCGGDRALPIYRVMEKAEQV